MDGNRFDELTRTLAAGTSRRRLLRGLVGGAAGGLLAHLGVRGATAQECREPGRLCNKNANCCSGLCDTINPDPFKRKRCLCPNGTPPVNGSCGPVAGPCTNQPNGTPCNDGNLCTQNDTCQSGRCVGGSPVVCQPLSQCHLVGTCNPVTGLCFNPTKPDGSTCNDGNACTQTDICLNGSCVGTNPVICTASDQCHDAGTCVPATGLCSNPAKPNGTACNDGNNCTTNDVCTNGACAGTLVVCTASDQCHDAGTCDPATGFCSNPPKPDSSACDDGNACTRTDTCQGGVCTGANSVVCTASDQCHDVGICNPATGACSNPPKADGTSCSDSNACTNTDTCQGGVCTPGTAVVCQPLSQCHLAGTCDPSTGLCSNSAKPNGTACNDGNLCTTGDVCTNGICAGTPVVCTPSDQCHDAGVCDPSTGTCSNPPKPNGSACDDGNACTQADTCQNGTCVGSNPVVCIASDQCHDVGTCDPTTGVCSNPNAADGTLCENPDLCIDGGTCQGGTCAGGTPKTCTPQSQCHSAACNPANGQCVQTPLTGPACEHPDLCFDGGTCTAGVCTGGTPVDCSDLTDQCNVGTCNPDTGDCVAQPTPGVACENPDLCLDGGTCTAQGTCTGGTPVACTPQSQCHSAACNPNTGACDQTPLTGTACDDSDACTQTDTCQNGACVGVDPVVCQPLDQCHVAGVCDPSTGLCSDPNAPDGTPCEDGLFCTTDDTCQRGTCVGGPATCPTDQCFECDEDNNICTGGCDNDRPLCCPGMNGHANKCCPTDNVCDYSPSGAVNCRNL